MHWTVRLENRICFQLVVPVLERSSHVAFRLPVGKTDVWVELEPSRKRTVHDDKRVQIWKALANAQRTADFAYAIIPTRSEWYQPPVAVVCCCFILVMEKNSTSSIVMRLVPGRYSELIQYWKRWNKSCLPRRSILMENIALSPYGWNVYCTSFCKELHMMATNGCYSYRKCLCFMVRLYQ